MEIFLWLRRFTIPLPSLQNGRHNFVSAALLRNFALLSTQNADALLVISLEDDILTPLGCRDVIGGLVQRHRDFSVALDIQHVVVERRYQLQIFPANQICQNMT